MFITQSELMSVIYDWQLDQITDDPEIIDQAIMAAMEEAIGYLKSQYDTDKIFSTTGAERNVLLVEHIKSMAVWYLVRLSNADMIFERLKVYYDNAITWLSRISKKQIAPDLPLRTDDSGEVVSRIKMGSRAKFHHDY